MYFDTSNQERERKEQENAPVCPQVLDKRKVEDPLGHQEENIRRKEKKTKGVKNTRGETAKKNHQKTNRSNLCKK